MGILFINLKTNRKHMKTRINLFISKAKGVWNTVGNLWTKTDTLYRTREPEIRSSCVPHAHRQTFLTTIYKPSTLPGFFLPSGKTFPSEFGRFEN